MSTSTSVNSRTPLSLDLASRSASHLVRKATLSGPSDIDLEAASASSLEDVKNLSFRREMVPRSIVRSAENTTANANTIPTSTSSLICFSDAASMSSAATWNVIDTDKSEPIVVNAAPVVPPAPLMSEGAAISPMLYPVSLVTVTDSRRATSEKDVLFKPFLKWQISNKSPSLYLRRLILRSPGPRRGRHDQGVQTSSCVFGTVLANLMAHCLLPRAKKSALIVIVRARLLRISKLLSLSTGPDVEFLARGLASAPLVRSQRRLLPEIKNARVDSRYGCVATPIGATAAIICTIALLVSRDSAGWMKERAVILSALVRAESQLEDWGQTGSWDTEARSSLEAEKRALARASKAVEVAILQSSEQNVDAMTSIRLQLAAAEHGAFPPCYIGQNTQNAIVKKIESRQLMANSLSSMEAAPPRGWPSTLAVVPLAALPADGSRVELGSSSSSGTESLTVVSETASVVSEWENVSVVSDSAVADVTGFEMVSVC